MCEYCDLKKSEEYGGIYRGKTMADDTDRRLEFKNPRIRIGTGRPEWGAEPGKLYFVISWDKE